MTLEEWQTYNNSCTKTLVFRFGTGGGFFSEYNNMIRMMIYCLIHKIKFIMYSENYSSHAVIVGWNRLFVPFTKMVTNSVFDRIDVRWVDSYHRDYYKMLRSIYHALRFGDVSYMYNSYMPIFVRTIILKICKRKYCFDYIVADLWYQSLALNMDDTIHISDFFDGTNRELFDNLDQIIWRFNQNTLQNIDEIKKQYKEKEYVAFHIRRGDKILETQYSPLHKYVMSAEQLTTNRNALVLSDDYAIIEEFMAKYKNWHVESLESKSNKGYGIEYVRSLTKDELYWSLISFLSQIELCKNAQFMIVTITSGIGYYLKTKFPNRCISVD